MQRFNMDHEWLTLIFSMKTPISVHRVVAEASFCAAMDASAHFISVVFNLLWILIRNLKASGCVPSVSKVDLNFPRHPVESLES